MIVSLRFAPQRPSVICSRCKCAEFVVPEIKRNGVHVQLVYLAKPYCSVCLIVAFLKNAKLSVISVMTNCSDFNTTPQVPAMLSPDFRFLWQFNGDMSMTDYLTEGKGPYATLRTALPDLFWNSYDYRVRSWRKKRSSCDCAREKYDVARHGRDFFNAAHLGNIATTVAMRALVKRIPCCVACPQ